MQAGEAEGRGLSAEGPGMRRRVDFPQGIGRDQRVHLRGGDGGMAQQFLDHADVGAAFQQVGGKGMAQGVRGDILGPWPSRRRSSGWSRRFAG